MAKIEVVFEKIDLQEELAALDLRPVFSRVIVAEKEAEQTGGGLYVPKTARRNGEMQSNEGVILALGEECDHEKFHVGDTVYYGKFSGAFISRPTGKEYRIMNEEDILGIVTYRSNGEQET